MRKRKAPPSRYFPEIRFGTDAQDWRFGLPLTTRIRWTSRPPAQRDTARFYAPAAVKSSQMPPTHKMLIRTLPLRSDQGSLWSAATRREEFEFETAQRKAIARVGGGGNSISPNH